MSRTIRFEASKPHWATLIPVGMCFALAAFGPFLREKDGSHSSAGWLLTLEFGLFGIFGCIHYWLSRQLAGRVAVVDVEGVGAEFRGQRLWTVPWDRYGGYRVMKMKPWEALSKPERWGIEVLDKEGVVVGTLPVHPRKGAGNTDHGQPIRSRLLKAFFKVLDDRATLGFTIKKRALPKPMNPKLAWPMAILGTMFLISTIGLGITISNTLRSEAEVTGWLGWLIQGGHFFLVFIPAFAGTLMSVAGWTGLARHRNPHIFEEPPRALNPEEGPHHEDHEVDLLVEERSFELVPGVRYRVVHADVVEGKLRSELLSVRVLGWLFVPFLAMPIAGYLTDPTFPFWLVVTCWSVFGSFGAASVWLICHYQYRLESLHDTLIYQDGMLVAVKPDGTHRSFRIDHWKPIKNTENSGEVLRDGKGKYYLDRARLFACDEPLEQEELAT